MKFTFATAGSALLFALVARAAPQAASPTTLVTDPSFTTDAGIPATASASAEGPIDSLTSIIESLTSSVLGGASESSGAASDLSSVIESVTDSVPVSGVSATESVTDSAPLTTITSSTGVIESITSALSPTTSSDASASSTGASNGAMPTGFAQREGLAMGLGAGLLAAALL